MKKINKPDLKKLALLGLAGGTIIASQQASADQLQDLNNYGTLLAFAGCGGGSCGAKLPVPPQTAGRETAWNGSYNQSGQNYYSDYQQPSHGCGSSSQQWQSYNYQQPSHGCGSAQPAPSYYTNAQPQQSHGCGAAQPAPSYYTNYQPQQSHGCGAAQPAPQAQASYQNNNSQGWNRYTADAAPTSTDQSTMPAPAPVKPVKPGQPMPTDPTAPQTPPPASYNNSNARNNNTSLSAYFTADASKPATQQASDKQAPMSESELVSKLNSEGKATFQSLDPAGKALALKLANQTCKGQNDCKGLNSCKTANNSCAGNGSCKGTSKGPFTDKNTAVKVAAKKMSDKRVNAASPS